MNNNWENTGAGRFCFSIQESIDCTAKEAKQVMTLYLKEKIGKFDSVGQFCVKNGTFLDPSVLRHAVGMAHRLDHFNS